MRSLVIIPARYGSSRLPGKPLIELRGISMIQRVFALAASVVGKENVKVATDDERIVDHVQEFGGEALMTDSACKNGTERVYSALKIINEPYDCVLNLQGDAVLTPPWLLSAVLEAFQKDGSIDIATPAVYLEGQGYVDFAKNKESGSSSGTLVVSSAEGNALYFSKSMIPFVRDDVSIAPSAMRHIGLYGYTKDALERYMTFPEGRFESREKLEQLRALEQGMTIRVVEVSYRGRTHGSVDNPEDIPLVEEIIEREGELVSQFDFT